MRTIVDSFFVSADAESNQKLSIKGIDGKNLWVDTDFNKYERAVQVATIESIPYGFSERFRYEIELNVGDKIYIHHFVVSPDNKYTIGGKEVYLCQYDQIFCMIKKGDIIPIEDWLFTVPVTESEEDCKTKSGLWIKPSPERKLNRAIVRYTNIESESRGIRSGDEVFYMDDADYEMEIEGKKLLRMKNIMLIAKFINDELTPFDDNFIIEVEKQSDEIVLPSGLVLVNLQKKREQFGEIYKQGEKCETGYEVGDKYMYLNGQGTKIVHNGKNYIVLRQRDLVLNKKMYSEVLSHK